MEHVLNPRGTLGSGDPSTAEMNFSGVLRLRGLPYSATVQDLHMFFQGYQLAPGGVHIQLGMDGRPNGDAFVEFTTEEQAEQALRTKNKERIGTRYIK